MTRHERHRGAALRWSVLALLAAGGCVAAGPGDIEGGEAKDAPAEEVLQSTQLAVRGRADGVGYRLVGPLPAGEDAAASFDPRARILAWFFRAEAGDTLQLSARGPSPAFDTVLFLYEGEVRRTAEGWAIASLGERVAWDDDGGVGYASFLSVEAPSSGGYLVFVRRYDLGGRGRVTVRLNVEARERACGGFVGMALCREGEYCQRPAGSCEPNAPGTCARQPEFCPELFQPVCGCDGRTYGNACKAAAAGVTVQGEGPCPAPPAESCRSDADCGPGRYCEKDACDAATGRCADRPEACILAVVDPVCGCDGRTYQNRCEAAAAGVNVAAPGACAPPYEPCAGKACGETCQLCPPSDPTCIETAVVKYCQADGSCSPEAPACPAPYDPCAGKACGALCRTCPPDDPGCVETAVVKYCQADGSCSPAVPECLAPPAEVCTDSCRWAGDGECDDGGPGSDYSVCEYGTDCGDCGARPARDCRDSGCPAGQYCSLCWGSWQCLPEGAVC